MVQLQINLSKEENKIINIVKSFGNFKTKEQVAKYIINKVDVKHLMECMNVSDDDILKEFEFVRRKRK